MAKPLPEHVHTYWYGKAISPEKETLIPEEDNGTKSEQWLALREALMQAAAKRWPPNEPK